MTDYLIEKGYYVIAFDLFIYGKDVFNSTKNLNIIEGDIRNIDLVKKSKGSRYESPACISNDPSFELNPKLGKSINLEAFEPLVKAEMQA